MTGNSNYRLFNHNTSDRVMLEVSIITREGMKITHRVDSDLWWDCLHDTTKDMKTIEDELVELLTTFTQEEVLKNTSFQVKAVPVEDYDSLRGLFD